MSVRIPFVGLSLSSKGLSFHTSCLYHCFLFCCGFVVVLLDLKASINLIVLTPFPAWREGRYFRLLVCVSFPLFYGTAAAPDVLRLPLKELSIVILKLVAKRTAVVPINLET